MKEKSELLLLFFVLNYIASLQVGLNEDEKEPQKIKIGSKVEYDKNNNYFSFQYEGSNAALIVKFIDKFGIEIILKNSKYKKIELNKIVGVYIGNLTKADTYYLEINCSSICCEIGGKFETSLYGDILETIDLSKNIYYQDFEIYSAESFYGNIKYKVSGLKEDKYVFFNRSEYYDTNYYYPYYPNESIVTDDLDSPDFSNLTIFEVTNISSGNFERNLNVYHFVKYTEYIINIHCLKRYSSYDRSFRYIQFFFIPITNSSIRRFQGDEGIITSEVPIHGIVESDNVKEFYIFCNYDINNYNKIYWVNTSEPIETFEKYLEILPKLQPINVINLHFQEEKTENTVILLLPESYEYKSRLYLVELFDDTCGKDFTLPANTNKIINCKWDEEDKIDILWTHKIFYSVITLTSEYKNMRYLFSEYDNNTDYIIHNHFFQPIYL